MRMRRSVDVIRPYSFRSHCDWLEKLFAQKAQAKQVNMYKNIHNLLKHQASKLYRNIRTHTYDLDSGLCVRARAQAHARTHRERAFRLNPHDLYTYMYRFCV